MFVFVFLLAQISPALPGCITYQQGLNERFDSPLFTSSQCIANPYKQTISFAGEFCALPQIIIRSVQYNRQSFDTYIFKILTITITQFQVQIHLYMSDCFAQYYIFEWAALIDNQLLVVNDFMQSITLIDGYRTALIPYPMQNTDYQITYSITSYSGGSPNFVVEKQATGFNLYVTGVESTQVSGLGVQIIAGLQSMYTLFDTLSPNCSRVNVEFPKLSGYTFLPTQIYIIALQDFHDKIISIGGTAYSNRQIYCSDTNPNTASANFKLYIYDFKYKPHYYKKIRVAHMMCLDYRIMHSFNTQKLQFIEIGKTWSDIDTVSIPMMEYNEARISLIYSHACQPNRKITVTILRQGNQGDYNYIYTQYCHRLYNLITMYIQLLSQRSTTSEFQLSLTAQEVQVQEKMLDTGNTFQLLKIEYQ